MPIRTIVFLLAVALSSLLINPVKADPPAIPRVLYHWTKMQNALLLASRQQGQALPLGVVMGALASNHSYLVGRDGLFTWTHPVTGLALNHREVYGGEVLLSIEIDPARAKIAHLQTRAGRSGATRLYPEEEKQRLFEELGSPNMLYHEVFGPEGKLVFREWVILSAEPVKSFTAHPDELFPMVQNAVEELKDPDFTYPDDALFSFVTITRPEFGPVDTRYYDSVIFRKAVAEWIEAHYLSQRERLVSELLTTLKCQAALTSANIP